jgi:formyltetrahydrofolate-dependent phosphoribosylglycinamide formyltransferase
MLNLADRIDAGRLDASIAVVIASNHKAAGIERAKQRGLDVRVVPRKAFDSTETFSDAVWSELRGAEVDLVVLAGFLSLLKIPDDYAGRVMNVHPALLPKFGGKGMYGRHVHEAVIAAGERESGCTVHIADNQYDHGPIVLQRRCEVRPDDTPETLAERVMAEERIAYPQAIQLFAEGKI